MRIRIIEQRYIQFDLKWLFLFSTVAVVFVWFFSNHLKRAAIKKNAFAALTLLSECCDPIGGQFDNVCAIQVANLFRGMDEEYAKEIFREYLQSNPPSLPRPSNGLEVIMPLVFKTVDSQPFLMKGGPKIVICNDIPFNTSYWIARNGEPNDYETYLSDIESEGRFVGRPLEPHDPVAGYQNATSLTSSKYQGDFLKRQLENLLRQLEENNWCRVQ